MGLAQLNQTRQTAAPLGPPGSFPMAPPMGPPQRLTMMGGGYEPSYYSQQQGVGPVSTRPAYESGFVLPPGFDPTQLHTPTGPVVRNPGYDRPHYGNPGAPAPAPYENSYPVNGMRRQSGAFPNAPVGMGPQSSRGQLREDSFY